MQEKSHDDEGLFPSRCGAGPESTKVLECLEHTFPPAIGRLIFRVLSVLDRARNCTEIVFFSNLEHGTEEAWRAEDQFIAWHL